MRLKTSAALLLSATLACASALGGTSILEKYSLEQLDSAGHLLMAAVDQNGLYCDLPAQQAGTLLLALHPLIDSKIKMTQLPPKWKTTWTEQCQKKCHCGIYAVVLEKASQGRMKPSHREALKKLKKMAGALSGDQLQACVQNTQWFCKSELLVFLKKAAPDYEAAPSKY